MEIGVEIVTAHGLAAYDGGEALLRCTYTGRERRLQAESVVMVTARKPDDALYRALQKRIEGGAGGAPRSLKRIGDCEAPAIIAAAVYAGHRYARELDAPADPANPAKYDRVFFAET